MVETIKAINEYLNTHRCQSANVLFRTANIDGVRTPCIKICGTNKNHTERIKNELMYTFKNLKLTDAKASVLTFVVG